MAHSVCRIERVFRDELRAASETFSFSWPTPEEESRRLHAFEQCGVLRPLSVIETPDGMVVVDGARRLAAARDQKVLWVSVLDGSPAGDLWDRLLLDREGDRALNPVELGLYLSKRSAHTGETLEALAGSVFPLLGLPPRVGAAAEYLWIAGLPDRHKDRFAAGEIPAQGLRPLMSAPCEDALAALDLTLGLRLGANKFFETARWLFECAWREGLTVAAWAERTNLPRGEGGETFREAVWKCRYPRIAEWTESFEADRRSAALPPEAQLSHAKGFEGGKLRLTLSFGSIGELRCAAEAVAKAAEGGGLASLEKYLG